MGRHFGVSANLRPELSRTRHFPQSTPEAGASLSIFYAWSFETSGGNLTQAEFWGGKMTDGRTLKFFAGIYV